MSNGQAAQMEKVVRLARQMLVQRVIILAYITVSDRQDVSAIPVIQRALYLALPPVDAILDCVASVGLRQGRRVQ